MEQESARGLPEVPGSSAPVAQSQWSSLTCSHKTLEPSPHAKLVASPTAYFEISRGWTPRICVCALQRGNTRQANRSRQLAV